ncbi:MAG: class I SAM-dependent methyltransferase [Promethearchaeota archaeon]
MKDKVVQDEIFKELISCYDSIANDFNRSRGKKPWKPFREFFESLIQENIFLINKPSTVLDMGCGNGRNSWTILENIPNIRLIELDLSFSLLKIAKTSLNDARRQVSMIQASMIWLPFRENVFDLIIAIASLHHLPSKRSLLHVLSSCRVLLDKQEGHCILSTWRKWQKKFANRLLRNIFRKFLCRNKEEINLVEVPWTRSRDRKVFSRKYYLLSRQEIFKLLKKNFLIMKYQRLGGPNKKDNHFIHAKIKEKKEIVKKKHDP